MMAAHFKNPEVEALQAEFLALGWDGERALLGNIVVILDELTTIRKLLEKDQEKFVNPVVVSKETLAERLKKK